jgi:Ser/Thr protein kinase RdoA (MazF antagonist)
MTPDSDPHAEEGRSPALDPGVRKALAAAVAAARGLGLPVREPRVLSNEQNLIVHLKPSPVVARVATRIAWSRPDPAAWLGREVSVAGHVAGRGGPVVAPSTLVDPGPHRSDGYALTLWTYVEPTGRIPSPGTVGEALARLHIALDDFPDVLPHRLPVHAQIEDGLAALERHAVLEAPELAALRDRYEEIAGELDRVDGTPGVVHGDAHPWNLLHVSGAWLWIDLEETGYGPREWDLAVLASKVEQPGEALLAYAAVAGRPIPEPDILRPFQHARELETVVWALGMAEHDPEGYREFAQDRLEELLGGAS